MKKQFAALSVAMTLISSCVLGQRIPLAVDQSPFTKENMMGNYTVVQRPSMIVVGIECRTSNTPEAADDIPQHWQKFHSEDIIHQIQNKASTEVVALYCDYSDAYKEGDYTQAYSLLVIGCPVSSLDAVPEGMVAKIVPSDSYAVFRAVGEYPESLLKTWKNIWQQADLGRICTYDYEVYGDKFTSESPKEVEIFIAIK